MSGVLGWQILVAVLHYGLSLARQGTGEEMVAHAPATAMSVYEKKALAELQRVYEKRAQRRDLVPSSVRIVAASAASRVSAAWEVLPGTDAMGSALAASLEGLRKVTLDPAMSSVRTDMVVGAYADRHPQVKNLEDIRTLDLEDCDRRLPNLRLIYASGAALEGAGASLAITGAEVSATVSGGSTAPVVAGAIAVDTASTLALAGRVIAHTAAYYGYDTRLPDEEVFALSVMSLSSAATASEKVAALAAISRLTQQMMRRATWNQLQQDVLVRIINQIYIRLGFRLTKAGLSKAVPIAGVVIGAGFNAHVLQKTARDAQWAYRTRFLADKYGIDPTEWRLPGVDPTEPMGDPINVEDFLGPTD